MAMGLSVPMRPNYDESGDAGKLACVKCDDTVIVAKGGGGNKQVVRPYALSLGA